MDKVQIIELLNKLRFKSLRADKKYYTPIDGFGWMFCVTDDYLEDMRENSLEFPIELGKFLMMLTLMVTFEKDYPFSRVGDIPLNVTIALIKLLKESND